MAYVWQSKIMDDQFNHPSFADVFVRHLFTDENKYFGFSNFFGREWDNLRRQSTSTFTVDSVERLLNTISYAFSNDNK